MSILERLKHNDCSYCLDRGIKNANYIDITWRNNINGGYWPVPFQESGFCLERVKAIVVGQQRPQPVFLKFNILYPRSVFQTRDKFS